MKKRIVLRIHSCVNYFVPINTMKLVITATGIVVAVQLLNDSTVVAFRTQQLHRSTTTTVTTSPSLSWMSTSTFEKPTRRNEKLRRSTSHIPTLCDTKVALQMTVSEPTTTLTNDTPTVVETPSNVSTNTGTATITVLPGAKIEYTSAIVGFGGSAPLVPHPDKALLGGKGLGLQEMSNLGIDVPPGFTLTTPICYEYNNNNKIDNGDHDKSLFLQGELWDTILSALRRVELDMGRQFGDTMNNPLLVSCRSGAAISMPGMMDTVLNVGLNSDTVQGLATATGNPRFAYDSYRRLLDMFGGVVYDIPHEAFEKELNALKRRVNVQNDIDLTAEHLQELCTLYQGVYKKYNMEFPYDVYDQLRACIQAVFASWNSERAIKYREINGMTNSLLGTACNIQTMVYGNLGVTSGTGVAFSRDPSTGNRLMKGEYLINAQGEDVVAGIRTPEPIATMKEILPETYEQFIRNVDILERHFQDMQDIEFTVENNKLWMLQCRSGKRTGHAAIKIAVDFVTDQLCTTNEALLKVEPDHIKQVLHPAFSPDVINSPLYKENVVATGLAGGPGAAVGKIVFTNQKAEAMTKEGVILIRSVTSPEDVGGMWAAQGILTSRGGVTSHAAVVARGWGKPCICGCDDLEIDEEAGIMTIKSTGEQFKEGDIISLNGSTGEVIRLPIITESAEQNSDFEALLGWADAVADSCKVMANADSGPDAAKAVELGAQGIGLCRTEHMFFAPDRLPVVRRWILRNEGLSKLQTYQRSDFTDIMRAMDGKPVTVRLLDPPLHEFLPKSSEVTAESALELGYDDVDDLKQQIEELHEENPMLGLRGCRLGICRPELTKMQVEAIMHAAADLIETGGNPFPRIMVPLIGTVTEFENQALLIKRTAERVKSERKVEVPYEIGTMIEVPRAALVSDQIAAAVDPSDGKRLCSFFSYGTNDLTQMTLGISRDDAGEFIPTYMEKGIYENDPFKTIDTAGVGWLLHLSAAKGRAVNPDLSLSICGEHGGDAESIQFFDQVGLDYVSCSPFRVPIARLAAAQAVVRRLESASETDSLPSKDRLMASSPLSSANHL
jgi:pyruvate, orthophosphate dikinase